MTISNFAHRLLADLGTRMKLRRCASVGRSAIALGRIWVRGHGQVHVSDGAVLDGRAAPIELFAHRGAEIRIGPGVRIEGGASLEAVSQVFIDAGARVGSFCKILDNHFHLVGGGDRFRRPPSRPVVVEKEAVLGARAILLPGARVGRGATVPPGAVVSRSFGAVAASDQSLAGATRGSFPVIVAGSDPLPGPFRARMRCAIGIARAAWYLRACKRVGRVYATGSVRVVNEGTVEIGDRTEFIGGMIPSEIVCRPGASIEIGSSSLFNYGVSLEACGSIRIGNRVMFGSFVRICDRRSGAAGPVAIGDDVWIAHGASIGPGVTIGSGSVVAAGSVVSSDVPAGSLAIGNPARCMRLSLRAEQPRGPTSAAASEIDTG
jgi:acetyltransferase-like isoleucine patch superfamily enzyme